MTVSRQPQITEELLSAYLDDQVTAEERTLIEAAIATDPAIAWQVDSLRQTVHLLQALPPLALPRTFTLEAILAEARTTQVSTDALTQATAPVQPDIVVPTNHASRRAIVRTPVAEEPENSWWQWFLQLWQGGNLQLRNAAAVALTLFFVLFAGDRFLVTTRPLVELTPAAPVAVIGEERTAVEQPVAPAAAELTATAAPSTVVATAATHSDNPIAASAPNNADTANTFAAPVVQPENNPRGLGETTFAAPSGAPGPREEELNPSGGGTDALTQNLRTTESGDRGMAKSPPPMSDAVAADTAGMQQYGIAATSSSTPLSALMSATMTNAGAISVTPAVTSTVTPVVTPTVTITQTVVPTVTMASVAVVNGTASTDTEGAAWLTWAQLITALSTVVLTSLWWRSRR